MEVLTRELLQSKLEKGEMGHGFRVLRKKGSQEIMVDPRGVMDHQTIAQKAGIENKDVAYAGSLTDLAPGELTLDRGGDSFKEGYSPESDGEAVTAVILLEILKQIDENLDLQIVNLF